MVNIKVRDFCFELKPITKNKSHFECLKLNYFYIIAFFLKKKGVCTLDP